MKVRILGTRGHIEPTAPGHALHSGVLIDDVLFDMGEREYLDLRPSASFITHLHEDHAFFVNDEDVAIDLPMFAPQGWRGRDLRPIRSTVVVNGMSVTPVPTVHSATVRSCAYLIEKDFARVLYTGDLISIQERYRDRIPDLDLVITDGSFIRRGGLVRRDSETGHSHGHTGIPDLIDFFTPLARRIVFTHFGSWFYKDMAGSTQRIKEMATRTPVDVAEDGMELEVGLD
jgi:ribonuclease BN (tRNA processing enzyme)